MVIERRGGKKMQREDEIVMRCVSCGTASPHSGVGLCCQTK